MPPVYCTYIADYSTQLTPVPSTEWKSQTKKILEVEYFSLESPERLLQALSQHPFLETCYSKHIEEGFSVAEHTEKVLRLAHDYQACLKDDVTKVVPWNHFCLFLALHDIGKGIARESESFAFGTRDTSKQRELETTQQILTVIMEDLEVPFEKIYLFCQMLQYDSLGLYLRGDIQFEEAFDNILEMAKNSQKAPSAFYRLFRAYHLVDAYSYPSLQPYFQVKSSLWGNNTLNYCDGYTELDKALGKALRQTEKGGTFFDNCLIRIVVKEDPELLQQDFIAHLPRLLKFLERKHKEMLAYPEKQEEYQSIKKGFRQILSYFGQGSENEKFTDLKSQLLNFRKDYLCRYSLNKVETFIRKKIAEKQVKDPIDLTPSALSLLKITYLHGAHSAILPILQRTEMHLMPFERLKQERITPLQEGSAAIGNNQYRLSGTSLDRNEVHHYATQENLSPIQPKEEQEIIQFLQDEKDSSKECTRIAKAVLRLRALDPGLYQNYEKQLSESVQKIESKWKEHPEMEKSILHLKKALDENLNIPEGLKNALREPYGIVFASTTIHTVTSIGQGTSDRCAQKAALVGKDIDLIFVKKENQERLNRFLEENSSWRATVSDLDQLPNAFALYQLASPYFAKIA